MMRPFGDANLMAALRQSLAAFEIQPAHGHRRIFLMAIQGDPRMAAAPELGRRNSLSAPWRQPAWTEEPEYGEEVLDAEPAFDERDFIAVPIQGKVLCDETGRYFERRGDQVRPLERVVRGPRGEWLALVPPQPRSERSAIPVVQEPVDDMDAEDTEHGVTQEEVPARHSYRALLPEPGVRRVVRLGDFRELLSTQLAHAERLREMHQLPCAVQLFEATAEQPLGEILEELKSASDCEGVQPLTASAAQLLRLAPVMARLPRVVRRTRRHPGCTVSGDRFFLLRLLEDPTEDTATAATTAAPAAAASAPAIPASPAGACLKTSVPEQFLKLWEFRFSREEVLFDVHLAAAMGPLRRMWRRVRGWLRGRREFRKWQALLCGRTLEEQLWAVRPPRESLTLPAVRDWAKRTLETAGYDPRVMLVEWEIFWRRKGV